MLARAGANARARAGVNEGGWSRTDAIWTGDGSNGMSTVGAKSEPTECYARSCLSEKQQ